MSDTATRRTIAIQGDNRKVRAVCSECGMMATFHKAAGEGVGPEQRANDWANGHAGRCAGAPGG